MAFAKPKYGSDFTYIKEYKVPQPDLKKGENTSVLEFRIIPPIKSFEQAGKWAVYDALHYGYCGTHPRDNSKKVVRPFVCPEQKDYNTKLITHVCKECNQIRLRKETLAAAIAKAEQLKKTPEEIRKLVSPLADWVKFHNRDAKWKINIKLPTNEFGVLKLSHTTKKLLDVEINAVMTNRHIDPIDGDQGVWFRITRVATGDRPNDVRDSVSIVMVQKNVQVDGQMMTVEVLKDAKLTEADFEQAMQKCADLPTYSPRISDDQIDMLVKSSGDPEEVDKIWGISHSTEESQEFVDDDPLPDFSKQETATVAQTAPITQDTTATTTIAPQSTTFNLGGIEFATPQKESEKPKETPVPDIMNMNTKEMTDEEFLKAFKVS